LRKTLPEIQTARFHAYKQSNFALGDKLLGGCKMQLELDDVCVETMLYFASKGHSEEFIRILELRSMYISTEVKQKAFLLIIESDFGAEMIGALVRDGQADVNAHVQFVVERDAKMRPLHWASLHGHAELLCLLLDVVKS
jgi:hypothetical protein